MSDEDVKADGYLDDGQQHCPDEQPQARLQFKHRIALLKFSARIRLRYLKRPAIMEITRFAKLQAHAQETINMIRADDLLTYDEQTQMESQ